MRGAPLADGDSVTPPIVWPPMSVPGTIASKSTTIGGLPAAVLNPARSMGKTVTAAGTAAGARSATRIGITGDRCIVVLRGPRRGRDARGPIVYPASIVGGKCGSLPRRLHECCGHGIGEPHPAGREAHPLACDLREAFGHEPLDVREGGVQRRAEAAAEFGDVDARGLAE